MVLAKVIGNIWSTKKKDAISALRLLLIQPLDQNLKAAGKVIVAADEIGAGFQEMVIVTRGAPAMQAFSKEQLLPIDAVVIGIVDNLEMADEAADSER